MIKNIKYFTLSLCILIFFTEKSDAQTNPQKNRHRKEAIDVLLNDTFNFVQLRNDPMNASNLSLKINPFYFELYGINSNLGYDASIRYRIQNKFAIGAEYRGSYFESVEKESIDQVGSFGGPATGSTNYQNFSLNAEYYFNTKLDTNVENVRIGRFRGFLLTERVTALYELQYGLRLGWQYFQTYISGNQIPFSGYYINDPNKTIISFGNEPMGTMMEENIINIGYSITSRHDLLISNHTLGKSKVMGESSLYGDILFAPAISYTNVIMPNYEYLSGEKYTDFNVNSGIPKSRFGARVGFDYADLSVYGLTFGLETGFRPGPSLTSGFYFMGKFGFILNTLIK